MASIVVREVPKLTEADKRSYTKLLAEAFGYRFFGGGLANDKSLQEPILEAHLNAAQLDGEGEIHVAEFPGVGVAGVAVWFGPGHMFLSTEAQRNAGWNQVMNRLPTEYQVFWAEFTERYNELSEIYLGPGVKLGAYHLQLIGVAPEHQKKGVATALMQYAEGKARAQQVPSVLETTGPTNVAIYKSLGYTAAGSTPIKAPPPSDGTFDMVVFIKHTEESDE